ncbi:hypothetical protein L6Q21_14475, partial [Sandaracinobacter sp. RS1-74]|uniref:hypothetical protein n=1 Tax=Sandaracinobacteroides sayramensis TaxID=2913411 RepID=UPI001EDB5964
MRTVESPNWWEPAIQVASFTEATGKVKVEAGAEIATTAATSVVESGGFVMLLGTEVENAGRITSSRGQTVLAAGENFLIRPGYGTDLNQRSTTRGQEVAATIGAESTAGLATNSGVIEAKQGDITLVGEHVVQDGVLVSTTSVHTRGTIHLLTNVADTKKDSTSVTLTKNSLTLILPELESDETATDAQRNALVDPGARTTPGLLNNQGTGNVNYTQPDRLDQSRVEIMTAGTALFEGDSLTMAQGGQISVMARKRTFVADGAVLDVSGVQGVAMDMESNSLLVSLIQPYDYRDSALNRENENLKSQNVWVDVRDLEMLPSGTGGHDGDRYYTPGGLIEVSGHLGNAPHKIGEWTATAGSITFTSSSGWTGGNKTNDTGELIVQKGAILDISGGSLDYASGFIKSTLYLGSDGKLYSADKVPANVKLVAIGANFMRRHERWGERYTEYFVTPFSRVHSTRYEEGYTVGRDAGTLTLSVPTVVMEGTLLADVIVGDRQTQARPDLPVKMGDAGIIEGMREQRIDGYKLTQYVAPLAGALYVGNQQHVTPTPGVGDPGAYKSIVTLADGTDITSGMTVDSELAPDTSYSARLSLDALNAGKLGALKLSGETIHVEADLTLGNGGLLVARAQTINIDGNITARSGVIALEGGTSHYSTGGAERVVTRVELAEGKTLDASGLWVNLSDGGGNRGDLAWLAGGDVLIRSAQGSVVLGEGSLIDVSAGGAILEEGQRQGASGGNVLLATGYVARTGSLHELVLDGDIRAYGSEGNAGGRLHLVNVDRSLTIGDPVLEGGNLLLAGEPVPLDLVVTEAFVLPAGSVLGFDYNHQITSLFGGETITSMVSADPVGLTTQGAFTMPASGYVYNEDYSQSWFGGDTVPAGTTIAYGSITYLAGETVGDDVRTAFPDGLPLANPIIVPIPAGTELENDLRVAAGTKVQKGWVLPVDVQVAKPLHLAADFFQKGFTDYRVQTGGDILVSAGAEVDVTVPTRRITDASFAMPSGTALADTMELWTPPQFREDAVNGRFVQSKGASLSLNAVARSDVGGWTDGYGTYWQGSKVSGLFELAEGALIRVGDGKSVTINAAERMRIEGSIEARAGSVKLTAGPAENMNRDRNQASKLIVYDSTRAIWIGSDSVIDVSGRAMQAVDRSGLRYADVSAGGSIDIGGVSSAYVVVRPGAKLDASGAGAEIDYLTSRPGGRTQSRLIASDGGRLSFASQYGIYLDGELLAHAGGEGALGGELAVKLASPIIVDAGANVYPSRAVPNFMRRLRSVIIDQDYAPRLSADIVWGDCITACWTPGQLVTEAEAANAGVVGTVAEARISAEQIKAGGFDSLGLESQDVVLFDGDLTLNLGRNLTLAGSMGNLRPEGGEVSLSAAYVRFAGGLAFGGNDITFENPGFATLGRLPSIGKGSLTISGGLVDMGGIRFGSYGSIGAIDNEQIEYDYASPKDVHIISRSDIRLTGGESISLGDLTLTAAQIYPLGGAQATILAGVYTYKLPNNNNGYRTLVPGGTLNIRKLEGSTAAAPLSVHGMVILGADIVNQGGVVRAPLGQIVLGVGGDKYKPGIDKVEPGQSYWSGNDVITSQVNLLAGSLTSVSAAGLTIAHGGTTDGLTWTRNDAVANGEGINTELIRSEQGVVVFASLNAEKGAVLDLSGGGTLSGAGFIPGRGGSVDILKTPLASVNPGYRSFSDPDSKVYAIVPVYQHSMAPAAIGGSAQPEFGQQIIIPEGVEGLKAGTYMLLPAEYALMEGAFRVELGKAAKPGSEIISRLPDGSTALGAYTSIAHRQGQSLTPFSVILTPAKVVETHSQYDKTTFEDFLQKMPASALFNRPIPRMPRDGKELVLALATPKEGDTRPAFAFEGTGLFAAAEGGLGGSVSVVPGAYSDGGEYGFEILADGATPTEGMAWLYASDLNRVGANALVIGGRLGRSVNGSTISVTPGGGYVGSGGSGISVSYTGFDGIVVRDGATLSAPQIFLVSDGVSDITVEAGATVSSLGKGKPAFDSTQGYTISTSQASLLMVSNGLLEMPAPTSRASTGQILVENGASLYSDGTIAFSTLGAVNLGEQVNYGARYMAFSTGAVNIGTSEALDLAGEQGILPGGIALNQAVLERLMLGDIGNGAPPLERLIFSAGQSINFYGSVNLDTRGPNGESRLQLVLNTPALYGHGTAEDVATISAGTLVWNGLMGTRGDRWNGMPISQLPGAPIAGGPGTGSGTLNLEADRIVLGYQDGVLVPAELPLDRLALGFGAVNLSASERIETNHRATISVWQSQAEYGKPGTGGLLNLTTPLLTGGAGSKMTFEAGGAVNLTAPDGWTPGTARAEAPMGAEIHLRGASILADTLVALPSGRLLLTATSGDVVLGERAHLDMAGRATDFFDETRYSWGGDVELESTHGSIRLAEGGVIDLSADYNHAGLLKVTALNGTVSLDGRIDGEARNGENDANPDLRHGSLDVRAGTLADFSGLNRRLTENGVIEQRNFLIKTGDLVIGDEVQARHVSLTADGGSLTVNGRIDASGAKPGSIRLSARDDLTLGGNAVLDARGTALQVDGYGAPIEASNRATVELTSRDGRLTLSQGAAMDLSSPDGVSRGRIELNVKRVGANDAAIEAAGTLTVKGASSIGVNAFSRYQPADGVIDQALLDDIHVESDAYINAAIANQALVNRLAGLRAGANAQAFHFRPGVELVSAAGGDLRVSGDLNMAGYRYASLNPGIVRGANYGDAGSADYGSGEAGTLLIRASDDLTLNGSITDGFAEPARTPDDNGWVLYPGTQGPDEQWIQDYKVPAPVRLAAGTRLPLDAVLGYDIEVNGFSLQPNYVLKAETRLAQAVVLDRDWTAASSILLPDGTLIARGTIMPVGTELPAGSVLGAGAVFPVIVNIAAMTWPKGVPLPTTLTLSATAQLQAGDLIPRDSVLALDGLFGPVLQPVVLTSPYEMVGAPSGNAVTTFPGGAASTVVLDFPIVVRQGTQVRRNVELPFGFESNASVARIAAGWTTTAPIWASKAAFEANLPPLYAAGEVVNIAVPTGSWFGAGTTLPALNATNPGNLSIRVTDVPAGTPLNLFNTASIFLNANVTAPAGATIPVGVNLQPVGGVKEAVRPIGPDGTQGRIWAAAKMLPQGSQSWSMRFVSGADIGSADARALRATSELAQAGQTGDLILSDRHYFNPQASLDDGFNAQWLERLRRVQVFSVVRTGIGSLDLLAGGSYEQLSLFGVYTAGTPSADIGGTTADGYNVYDQPRAVLAGSAGLANPYIGANFDGYVDSISDYQAWYPEHGGDLLLSVQGNITGYQVGNRPSTQRPDTGNLTNWLWRQGAYGLTEGSDPQMGGDIPTAWWIHFGGYIPANPQDSSTSFYNQNAPILLGFTGIGTLGGGNLTVSAGGNVGVQAEWGRIPGETYENSNRTIIASQALNFAVASTGRVTEVTRVAGFVTGGKLTQTGGGEMQIRIGGTLNPMAARIGHSETNLFGTITNLRGDIEIMAGSIGREDFSSLYNNMYDPRTTLDIGIITTGLSGGITLVPGDGKVRINTRGHLALTGVGDAGAIPQLLSAGTSILSEQPPRVEITYLWDEGNWYDGVPGTPVGDAVEWGACNDPGQCIEVATEIPGGVVRSDGGFLRSSFSLWREDSAIHLFSAGGNVAPMMMGLGNQQAASGNAALRDNRYWYPPILTATAPSGNIHWTMPQCGLGCNVIPFLELSPSPQGQMEFLAGGSIIGGTSTRNDTVGDFQVPMPVTISGMPNDPDLLPNPFRPVYSSSTARTPTGSPNLAGPLEGNSAMGGVGSNLAFQQDNATGRLLEGQKKPALFYAGKDILGFAFGVTDYNGLQPLYMSSGSASIRAGRDIVHLGTTPSVGCLYSGPADCRAASIIAAPGAFRTAGLVVHNDPRDITLVSAGRDIIYANMTVAGPGNLIVEAGRHVYQEGEGRLTSVGPLFDLNPQTRMGGAAITVLTGVGAGGPSYDAFSKLYLDPVNLANPDYPLVHPENEGKVVHTYEAELAAWLFERYGYVPEGAFATFLASKGLLDADGNKLNPGALVQRFEALGFKDGGATQENLTELLKDSSFFSYEHSNGETVITEAQGETVRQILERFDGLRPVERGIFTRQAYYDELKAGG